ncbi:dihydropteroate synthase [Sphingomonas oleivorans]|uniref:dihydropteroate synthase n=1 Tax=Sphingomonas oleivorans TaxID=1735121 RepID=A0A2T5G043_9SPHN|nr:dihydropteroate synthase [Sphingomonas oleivorans]PTQ12324.1 dihydropteroate synthase [Sphingomonas oleivorans]
MIIPPAARLYFRPTAFIDAASGAAGRSLRLAGGPLHFSALEVIALLGGKRVAQPLIPVARLHAFLATLDEEQQAAAHAILARLTAPRAPLALGPRTIRLDRPQAMAILNMTPDSFSDGGVHIGDPAAAAAAGMAMVEAGAAILDIGGESTRPGAATVAEDEEMARTLPIIERLAAVGAIISIDTRKAAVMEAALAAGAHIVNDVSALCHDPRALELVARAGCPVILMHHLGTPATMQDAPRYEDVLIDVHDWLEARILAAEAAGIDRARIIVDPGIGFGKTLRHNLALLNGLSLFHGLGCPILLGASRKRLIGALSNDAPADRRLGGSIALALSGAAQGAQLLRVHDVFETVQALDIWRGLHDAAFT